MKVSKFHFQDREEAYHNTNFLTRELYNLEGDSLTNDGEHGVLFELARGTGHIEATEGYCLDLGTYYGASALVMAQGVKESRVCDGPVWTVDAYPVDRLALERGYSPTALADEDWIEKTSKKPMVIRAVAHRLGLSDYIVQVIHDSPKFLKLFNLPVRLAFIDSSHDYETCFYETLLVQELLVPGGAIVYHDVEEHEPVQKVVEHFYDEYLLYDRLGICFPK